MSSWISVYLTESFFSPYLRDTRGQLRHRADPRTPTSHFYGRIRVCTVPVHGATRPKRVFELLTGRKDRGREVEEGEKRSSRPTENRGRTGRGRFTTLGALDPNSRGEYAHFCRGRKNREPGERRKKCGKELR